VSLYSTLCQATSTSVNLALDPAMCCSYLRIDGEAHRLRHIQAAGSAARCIAATSSSFSRGLSVLLAVSQPHPRTRVLSRCSLRSKATGRCCCFTSLCCSRSKHCNSSVVDATARSSVVEGLFLMEIVLQLDRRVHEASTVIHIMKHSGGRV
jgi:hypothetical protein